MCDTYPFNDNKYAKKAEARPVTSEPVDRILHKIQGICKKRGNDGFKGLSSMFRLYDSDRSNNLDTEEVKIGLSRYGVDLSQEECDTIFAEFDVDGNGTVNLTELMRSIKPPMSTGRVAMIEKAFKKMDNTGDGIITQADISKAYNLEQHPKFKAGLWTAERCYKEFLDSFQQNSEIKDEKVTLEEFQDYYAGVSANIDKDVYFDYMMRQTWKI